MAATKPHKDCNKLVLASMRKHYEGCKEIEDYTDRQRARGMAKCSMDHYRATGKIVSGFDLYVEWEKERDAALAAKEREEANG